LRKKYCLNLKNDMPPRDKKVFNWETAKYGKIWYDEDVRDLISVETKFPAIVFNDNLISNETHLCEPTVSSLNSNEIDFRISFDESDDEGYTNEVPAIVYNDALTSKSDFSTEPTLCPRHIDEFDLKDETSLSEYNEEEQNILYFNDLFPFNIIYLDDLKSDKDNDDDKIDIIQSSGGNVNTQGSNKLLEASRDKINKIFNMKSFIMELNVNIVAWNYFVNRMLFNLIKNLYVSFGISFDPKRKIGLEERIRHIRSLYGVSIYMAPLPPREQRYPFFRYQGLEYYDQDIADFKERLERIHVKGTHRVQVLDFEGMPEPMRDVLYARMLIEHLDDDRVVLGGARRHMSWRKFILALGLHTGEEMESPDFARAGCWIGQHPLLVGPISEEIYVKLGDTWAWVPVGPARQEGDAGGVAEEAFGGTKRFTTWTVTSLSQMMDRTGATYTRYSESPVEYQRHSVRQRTDEPSTSAAPQQHDP
ncbi:hypothetical protein Tco_0143480, partial [Tanacetum coccineum]